MDCSAPLQTRVECAVAGRHAPVPTIPLVAPLSLQASVAPTSRSSSVILVSHDGVRFAVDRQTLLKFSATIRDLLADDSSEEVGDDSLSTSGPEIPLATDRAPSQCVQLLATWFEHHQSTPPSVSHVPLPARHHIEELYSDPWDLQFIQQHVSSTIDNDLVPSNPQRCYALALLSVFLSVDPLTEMLVTWLSFYLRKGVRETCEPTKIIRQWFGKDGEYNAEELEAMTSWTQATCRNMKLRDDVER